jgi:hypothetical protein
MVNRHCCCRRDYTMEGSPTGTQKTSRQSYLVKSLQKKEVEGATSIHQHSVHLDISQWGRLPKDTAPALV